MTVIIIINVLIFNRKLKPTLDCRLCCDVRDRALRYCTCAQCVRDRALCYCTCHHNTSVTGRCVIVHVHNTSVTVRCVIVHVHNTSVTVRCVIVHVHNTSVTVRCVIVHVHNISQVSAEGVQRLPGIRRWSSRASRAEDRENTAPHFPPPPLRQHAAPGLSPPKWVPEMRRPRYYN